MLMGLAALASAKMEYSEIMSSSSGVSSGCAGPFGDIPAILECVASWESAYLCAVVSDCMTARLNSDLANSEAISLLKSAQNRK